MFVHLHVHSDYSLMDGLATVDELAARAAKLGQPALALTDHGTLAGAVAFYEACLAHDVKPIIGLEAYMAPTTIDEKSKETRTSHHITLLAMNNRGWHDLCELTKVANLKGYYYKPRIDKELLLEYGDDLLILSGCSSSELSRLIQDGKIEQAEKVAAWYKENFGGRYLIELQHHDLDFMVDVWPEIIRIGEMLELPMVVTNDVHYADRQDREVHDALKALAYGKRIDEGAGYNNDSYYMKSREEMERLYPRYPQAIENTVRVASVCNWHLEFGNYHLPPAGVSRPHAHLRALCEDGLKRYYDEVTEAHQQRLEYELGVIEEMGFSTYFLIFKGLINFCKTHNIVWNIRGSAAGSIVAYTLGMTGIDPLKHGLIFERFLNPDRITMPDIDMDVPDDRRQDVIDYLIQHYGHVAQIGTFSRFGARRAIRDAGKVLGVPWKAVNEYANQVPEIPGITLDEAVESGAIEKDVQPGMFRLAHALEGRIRHAGTHAGGILVGDKPLTTYIPLRRPTSKNAVCDTLTETDMRECEHLGLLKLDILGLRTLRTIAETLALINARHDVNLEYQDIPTEDEGIWEVLSSGDTTGVFQVSSSGFRGVLQEIAPHKFEHVVAALALYRPGPMDHIQEYADRLHGRSEPEYSHPVLEPILKETYGVLTYQEQVMRVCTDLAGFTAAEADIIRKAVGKKDLEVLKQWRARFIQGAEENYQLTPEHAEQIWELFIPFSRYGFNKAHATDYAVLTTRTAYLRHHYLLEFMTALFRTEAANKDDMPQLLQECRAHDIQALTPNIQTSERWASIEDNQIRLGLQVVKFLGEKGVDEILKAREDGPFTSPHDFCNRVNRRRVNIRAITALVKVGAFDVFGDRGWLLEHVDEFDELGKDQDLGQAELFHVEPQPQYPIADSRRLDWERILLGGYVSGHPLARAQNAFRDRVTAKLSDIPTCEQQEQVCVLGMTQRIYRHTTKNGKQMAFITLEDLNGVADVVVFPSQWKTLSKHVEDAGTLLMVKGTVDHQHGDPSVVANSIKILVPKEEQNAAKD